MSNKLKTFMVYDEIDYEYDDLQKLSDTSRETPDKDLLNLMLPDLSNYHLTNDDVEIPKFDFDNQYTSIADSIEAEYGKSIIELSTDVPLYWFVARAMLLGSKEDSIWVFDDNTLVWC